MDRCDPRPSCAFSASVPPRSGPYVVVVGGANTDIIGTPAGPLIGRDSNPGTVHTSAGGVGRNIAENLARLGADVHLITALGVGSAAAELVRTCETVGVRMSASIILPDMPDARYVAIVDEHHDMAVAVNDMRVFDAMTPGLFESPERSSLLASAAVVVVDANLPAEVLEWLADHVTAPLVLDPVSAAKAGRACGVVGRLAALTPNALEAGVLVGHAVTGLAQAAGAAAELVAAGAGAAYVTCGREGVAWADGSTSGTVPAPAVHIANASGAGDAFCAGVVFAMLAGASAETAANAGSAMAAVAMADEDTVSGAVSRDTLAAACPGLITDRSGGRP